MAGLSLKTGLRAPLFSESLAKSQSERSSKERASRKTFIVLPHQSISNDLSSKAVISVRKGDLTRRRALDSVVAKSSAVSAAVAVPGDSPTAQPAKFLGVEVVTLKKVIPLGLIFFCILFNYTILRDTKDVLVVTAPGSGAEIIPFLKTWVNLPLAIAFMVLYSQMANVLSKEALFYSCILPFLAFFGSFAFVLYPLRDILHPTAFAEKLLAVAGPRFMGPISILRNWSFCLFYVMAELWGSVVVSVLFWGFANQVRILNITVMADQE